MSVLDRYLFAELISPFFFGGALFTFFLVIDRIYHLTDLVITKGVPFQTVPDTYYEQVDARFALVTESRTRSPTVRRRIAALDGSFSTMAAIASSASTGCWRRVIAGCGCCTGGASRNAIATVPRCASAGYCSTSINAKGRSSRARGSTTRAIPSAAAEAARFTPSAVTSAAGCSSARTSSAADSSSVAGSSSGAGSG